MTMRVESMKCISLYWFYTNSLWPCDTIWWHKSGSLLAQVMGCCLTAPSHYLNQCWHISAVLWDSPESNFTSSATIRCNDLSLAEPIPSMILASQCLLCPCTWSDTSSSVMEHQVACVQPLKCLRFLFHTCTSYTRQVVPKNVILSSEDIWHSCPCYTWADWWQWLCKKVMKIIWQIMVISAGTTPKNKGELKPSEQQYLWTHFSTLGVKMLYQLDPIIISIH